MNKEEFLQSGLLEQYVLGLTDAEETKKVEEFLQDYPELREEAKAMHAAIEHYASRYAISPPEKLKHRILQEIDKMEDPSKVTPTDGNSTRMRTRSGQNFAYAAGIALLMGSVFLFFQIQNLKQETQAAKEQLAACQSEVTNLRQRQIEREPVFAVIQHPGTHPVALKDTAPEPAFQATAYWNAETQTAYLQTAGLPQAPSGHQYQVWADVDGEMINVGLIDPNGAPLQPIAFLEKAESLNITIEPLGGSKHPNTDRLVAAGRT